MTRLWIDSLDDPRVASYRQLKGADVMRRGERFIAEGNRVVERLLASDYQTESVLLAEKREEDWTGRIPDHVTTYIIPQSLGEQLVGFSFHVGVLACGFRRTEPTLDQLLAHTSAHPTRPGLQTFVLCPNCDNPENLGAILRLARAFGVDGLILGPHCCDPLARRVLRVSMGNALWVPTTTARHWREWLDWLDRLRAVHGVRLIGSVLDEHATPLRTATAPASVGLLLGNEADGLDAETLSRCDERWTIPMHGDTDSLNVAVAAGVFLHHLRG